MTATLVRPGTAARAARHRAARLHRPVDASGLAFFRIAYGATVAWEVVRYVDHGLIRTLFVDATFVFGWWPLDGMYRGPGLYAVFAVVFLSAVGVAAGAWHRVSASVLFVSYTYWFLLDKSEYRNHLYLLSLLAALMVVTPAANALSVDALRGRVRSAHAGVWAWWLIRLQVAVPYFFGGVAKLNEDWLVRGDPLATWLRVRTDLPVVGDLLRDPAAGHAAAVGAAAFDLCIVPLLLWRRTRLAAYALAVGFHLLNARLWDIGVFPWLMIVGTLVFFDAGWPARLLDSLHRLDRRSIAAFVPGFVAGAAVGLLWPPTPALIPALSAGIGVGVLCWHAFAGPAAAPAPPRAVAQRARTGRLVTAFVVVWVAFQVLVPLRHWAIPGDVAWTEEGHRFSWRMLLDDKEGTATFRVTSPSTGLAWEVEPGTYLSARQLSMMTGRPDMIVQFAHLLEDHYSRIAPERGDLEIRAEVWVALNYRSQQLIVDPDVDLTSIRRPLPPRSAWIPALQRVPY